MTSPAERYAAFRAEQRRERSALGAFQARFSFALDPFQIAGCEALEQGDSVLVAAPTGAGKTVVGEFAVHLALARGQKVFYTAPIKALSNQKYLELVEWLGSDRVGLLTGDTSVRPDADVVVMTTEVLRNMLYADSSLLHGLGFVVMDEVHYLADRLRGPVWEEVIIHLEPAVQLVALSATVSNAEEFGAWINEIRPTTQVIVSEERPVPLWQHVLVGDSLVDLFVDDEGHAVTSHGPGSVIPRSVNPQLERLATLSVPVERGPHGRGGSGRAADDEGYRKRDGSRNGRGGHRGRGGRSRRGTAGRHRPRGGYREGPSYGEDRGLSVDELRQRKHHGDHQQHSRGARRGAPRLGSRSLRRPQVISLLDSEALLPAIFFIFSRAGCDAAVTQCAQARLVLTTPEEQRAIRWILDERLQAVGPEDEAVLRIDAFRRAALNGYAAHHAGILPLLKTVVEELFSEGLIKVVFATETLALGINMPARSVVLEKLVKFNGVEHADLTPGEFTQLTGRAGRRGIDTEGHAVVQVSGRFDPDAIGQLASKRTYPLRSAFRPTANMTVNLLDRFDTETARETLTMSFAQFQADRSVVGLARRLRELEETASSYRGAVQCERGNIQEYLELRSAITAREKELSRQRAGASRDRTRAVIRSLQRGQILALPGGRRQGFGVVLDVDRQVMGGPQITLLTPEAKTRRIVPSDLPSAPAVIDTMRLPRPDRLGSAKVRRDTASALRQRLTGHDEDPRRAVRAQSPRTPSTAATDPELQDLRAALEAHPCHQCPDMDAHQRWWSRLQGSMKEISKVERRIESRTSHLTQQFEHLSALLTELGYLEVVAQDHGGGHDLIPTARGQRLGRLFSDRDLLIAECLEHGAWEGLSPASFAAIVSTCTYEARREDSGAVELPPDPAFDTALRATTRMSTALRVAQHRAKVELTAEPDAGIAAVMHRWASGEHFAASVSDSGLPAGDFVRQCRQVVDLLSQLTSDPQVGDVAHRAIDAVRRGLVAQELGDA